MKDSWSLSLERVSSNLHNPSHSILFQDTYVSADGSGPSDDLSAERTFLLILLKTLKPVTCNGHLMTVLLIVVHQGLVVGGPPNRPSYFSQFHNRQRPFSQLGNFRLNKW